MTNPFKTKQIQPPTLAERQAQAQELSVNAVNVFRAAAEDLEVAGQLKAEIAEDIDKQANALRRQADDLDDLSFDLDDAAEADANAAAKIRDLFAV